MEELEVDPEDFVDAPDSQIGLNDDQRSQADSSDGGDGQRAKSGRQKTTVETILGPIVRYLTMQKQETQRLGDTTSKWQRRIESALIKMNAEMAALREQLEMQQQSSSVYSSLVHPFKKRKRGILGWMFDCCVSIVGIVTQHIVIDAMLLVLVTAWMHYRGIPAERLEELINSWIRSIQQLKILQRFKRIQQGPTGRQIARSIPRSLTLPSLRSRR